MALFSQGISYKDDLALPYRTTYHDLMIIYGIPTCDTCRKASKALKEAGHEATLRDIRKEPLEADDIARFYDAFGDKLLNRASTTWRNLAEADRQEAPQALLSAHPTLMKRPVIESDGQLFLGWSSVTQDALLK